MLNDKDDDKYDGPEETAYHFSDEEEVGYDVEPDAQSEEAHTVDQPETKVTQPAPATSSKRMMISLVVFLSLIFVVYKMVAPTSTTPSTEIMTPVVSKGPMTDTPPVASQAQTVAASAPAPVAAPPTVPQNQVVQSPEMTQQPVAAPPAMPATTTTVVQQVPTPAVTPPPTTNSVSPTQVDAPPVSQVVTVQPQPPVAPPAAAQPAQEIAQPVVNAPTTQVMAPAQTTSSPTPMPANSMPSVIPVAPPPMAYNTNPAMTTTPPVPTEADVKLATMQAESVKLMGQLQTDYAQKMTEFQTQNKALQSEVETLNARIATMEMQLNQLVQTLTRQGQSQSQSNASNVNMTNDAALVPESQQPSLGQRLAYNVQAIIPGRAWLKADNGETVTVAEGDTIKNLGRVTRIDPYDGIVEINTGHKTISLSYGTGA